MSDSEPDVDRFIEALRSDLPDDKARTRSRARLVAAGVIVSAGVAAPSTAGAASAIGVASTKAGAFAKLAALPASWKVALVTTAVTAAVVPAASQFVGDPDPQRVSSPTAQATPATRGDLLRSVTPSAAEATETSVAPNEQSTESASAPLPAVNSMPPSPNRSVSASRARGSEGALYPNGPSAPSMAAATPNASPAALPGASVGAFPIEGAAPPPPPVSPSSTLREETELVERGLAAMRAGDRASAIRWLEEHARRFPNGILARDRQRALGRVNGM